jgi:hypothetical protein
MWWNDVFEDHKMNNIRIGVVEQFPGVISETEVQLHIVTSERRKQNNAIDERITTLVHVMEIVGRMKRFLFLVRYSFDQKIHVACEEKKRPTFAF